MSDDALIHRVRPDADSRKVTDTGELRCRVCGKTWPTDPATDALLDEILEHEDTHRTPGQATSTADPPISTR